MWSLFLTLLLTSVWKWVKVHARCRCHRRCVTRMGSPRSWRRCGLIIPRRAFDQAWPVYHTHLRCESICVLSTCTKPLQPWCSPSRFQLDRASNTAGVCARDNPTHLRPIRLVRLSHRLCIKQYIYIRQKYIYKRVIIKMRLEFDFAYAY